MKFPLGMLHFKFNQDFNKWISVNRPIHFVHNTQPSLHLPRVMAGPHWSDPEDVSGWAQSAWWWQKLLSCAVHVTGVRSHCHKGLVTREIIVMTRRSQCWLLLGAELWVLLLLTCLSFFPFCPLHSWQLHLLKCSHCLFQYSLRWTPRTTYTRLICMF